MVLQEVMGMVELWSGGGLASNGDALVQELQEWFCVA